ncbi:receptor-like protein EIX2 isoform X4 [Mercurialis annua]|uniref:receptor-like protein EIX2 isoform X4 n=1 Tax=Mercurialis annua TaxID=3986 RepID=UPI002160CB27|nr:receptor-like protein EIX2 isoform X4 [Mercurialis annua]
MEVYAVSLLVFLALAAILDTGSCDGSTNVSCIESEKQALLRFKQGLIDPLERLSSWSASNKLECCNWTGIICDKLTGHVKELHLDNPYTNWERQMESEALARSELQDNNLSGSIPRCLNNLTAMIDNPHSYYQLFHSLSFGNFMDEALVVMKGREAQYDTVLTMVTNLDFSSNKLSGEIPEEITALVELIGLNLSGNYLTGEIPKNTGNMQKLESVDLSRNQISGNIPPSLSRLIILSYLDLSYNNLSGQILHSTQLQTFPASRFIGNRLCGPPLTENWSSEITCPDDESGSENAESGSEEEGYFVSMAFGFGMAFGFWWILCPLLFSRRWRYSYYAFLNRMWNSLYIKFAIARRGNI